MIEKVDIGDLYGAEAHEQWAGQRTMEHASGIWGREPMLRYLEENIVKDGDVVVDLGAGGGYPSVRVAKMVGEEGHVVGIELNANQLGLEGNNVVSLKKKYKDASNLDFVQGNLKNIPLQEGSADHAVSFMVLHNLEIASVKSVLKETQRILKKNGTAVFLTLHPDFLNADWDMNFMKYEEEDLKMFRESGKMEDYVIRGIVKNVGGGEKKVVAVYHSWESIMQAIKESGLTLIGEADLRIDAETVDKTFGKDSYRKLPDYPAFWMITLQKK